MNYNPYAPPAPVTSNIGGGQPEPSGVSSLPPGSVSYRLDPSAFAAAGSRRISRRFAWLIPLEIALAGSMVIVKSDGLADAVPTLALATLILGTANYRGFRGAWRSAKQEWDSYDLTLSDDVMRRCIANLPTIEITRPEVTRITESPGSGLTVATNDRHRFIFVPEQLPGYKEVRTRLAQWKEFSPLALTPSRYAPIAWFIALFGSWVGTGVLRDTRLAILSGAVLVFMAAATVREILNSQVRDRRTKSAIIGGICFMLLTPVARLIFQFGFHLDFRSPYE